MTSQYKCIFCQSEISLDDVNVARDMALCRGCGKTMSFSMVTGSAQIGAVPTDKPPRWVRVDRRFDGTTRIVYRRPSLVALFFIPFFPFAFFWSDFSLSGFCVQLFKEGNVAPHHLIIGLNFLLVTVVMVFLVLYLLFGKWVITLDRAKRSGSVFIGLGGLGWTRRFTFNRESLVALEMTNVEINNVHQKGISITTDGKKVMFGTLLTEDAKNFIAATILQEVNYA